LDPDYDDDHRRLYRARARRLDRRRHDRRYLSGLQSLATRPDHRFDQDVVRSLRPTSFGSLRLCENVSREAAKKRKSQDAKISEKRLMKRRLPKTFPRETLLMALDSVRAHKFRSALTVLGIVIGVLVAMVVVSILTGLRARLVRMV